MHRPFPIREWGVSCAALPRTRSLTLDASRKGQAVAVGILDPSTFAIRHSAFAGTRSLTLDASRKGQAVAALKKHRLETGATAAYTLLEVLLVISLLVAISAMTLPSFLGQIEKEKLPGSAGQLRSLVSMVRANAAYDGKRYRIRFPGQGEEVVGSDNRQPIVERENDPVPNPELYVRVTAPWAIGDTLLGDVWCAEVRAGRPTIEKLRVLRDRGRDEISEQLSRQRDAGHFEPERPPLSIEPDGASDWVTFVLTNAPRRTAIDQLKNFARLELIVEGSTGLAWIQRPFYDEELNLFEEKGWPAVLRQDFTDPRELTENDVLELRDITIKPSKAQGP